MRKTRLSWGGGAARTIGGACLLVVAVAAIFAPAISPHNPFSLAGPPLDAPSSDHLMGTDALGRDLFSTVVHGARTSMAVGVSTAVLAGLAGVIIGLASGYWGGWVDQVLMRLTEFVQIVPRFFLAIVVLAIFGSGYSILVLVLAMSSWPVIARSVRAEVFSLRESDYVKAAVVLGAPGWRIVLTEIMPAVHRTVLVLTGLLVADTILIEASLSFLGLGDPNQPSWGRLASEAQLYLRSAWWIAFFPGMAIMVTVLGINLLIDSSGARDSLSKRVGISR